MVAGVLASKADRPLGVTRFHGLQLVNRHAVPDDLGELHTVGCRELPGEHPHLKTSITFGGGGDQLLIGEPPEGADRIDVEVVACSSSAVEPERNRGRCRARSG